MNDGLRAFLIGLAVMAGIGWLVVSFVKWYDTPERKAALIKDNREARDVAFEKCRNGCLELQAESFFLDDKDWHCLCGGGLP